MAFLRSHQRLWLFCLLLAAVTAQALIPAGFMPAARAHDGKIEIVICTGTGPATILMDAHMVPGADQGGHDNGQAQSSCPFAPVMAAGAPDIIPPIALHPAPAGERPVAAPESTWLFTAPKTWFAQGPPYA